MLTWVYLCVVERLECPNISCISRISAPASKRCVANVWRRLWGLTFRKMPECLEYFLINLPTLRAVNLPPRELTKMGSSPSGPAALRAGGPSGPEAGSGSAPEGLLPRGGGLLGRGRGGP